MAVEYCKQLNCGNGLNNIVKKISAILQDCLNIKDMKCTTVFPYEKIYVVPFQNFNEGNSAGWWQDYNKVKHFRADVPEIGIPNYQLANLKNVLLALSALFTLSVTLYGKIEGQTDYIPQSKIFHIE